MTVLALCFAAAVPVAALFDRAAILFVRGSDAGILDWLHAVTDIGRSHWYLVPASLVLFWIAARDWTRSTASTRARFALVYSQSGYAFAAIALSGLAVNVLKVIFGRHRPAGLDSFGAWAFEPFTTGYMNASFPSGHSTTMGAVAAVLILWFPRWWLVVAEVCFVLAASRIAAQAHYPSDVVAGFGFGLVAALTMARWLAARGIGFRAVSDRFLPPVATRRPDTVGR